MLNKQAMKSSASRTRAPWIRALAAALLCAGVAAACGGSDDPMGPNPEPPDPGPGEVTDELRDFIDQRVGGIEKLMVPVGDADIPQPLVADGSVDPRFETTEAKRYLGKQLYFDPIRTNNIRPQFGGDPATAQTGSCGSCHLGEFAGKAGTVINGGVGNEGRGYTDSAGNFIARRRSLPGLVDTIPTLTDIFDGDGTLVATGAADAVDSVQRLAPTMVGFAYNNRLLAFGLAGEPDTPFNPQNLPAGENLTQLTITVHRMIEAQAAALQEIPVYKKLFEEAFLEEAALAATQNDLDLLINDDTVLRAMASFLRTVVTRNTAWDRFLAGDDNALTAAQRRGAELFFTAAENGGAGCVACHSGPMLNKQLGDEAGLLVEENFINIGLDDHPLVALDREALANVAFRDTGRMQVTGRSEHAFRFRVPALRQVADGGQLMHNGSFTSVRDVVEYFNAGVPQNAEAAAAPTLSPLFTKPRGASSSPGLGLDDNQVSDIVDFLENALYDPALVEHDPTSTTRTFALNEEDLTYSTFRQDLAILGAVDGRMPSGLPPSNNDALSRRDMGLEFLDVTDQLDITMLSSESTSSGREDVYQITNNSSSIVDTHLLIIAQGLSDEIRLENASGTTSDGAPYCREFLRDGVLLPGESIVQTLRFDLGQSSQQPVDYSLVLLSGQGNP